MLYDTGVKPGDFDGLTGDVQLLKSVEMVDQNPIGKSSRSEPRRPMQRPTTKSETLLGPALCPAQRAGRFGILVSHRRRPLRCRGRGRHQGLDTVPGRRGTGLRGVRRAAFRDEVLEVKYRGKSIYDVLEMTVDDAIAFFGESKKNATCRRIVEQLQPLQDVGLGYIS